MYIINTSFMVDSADHERFVILLCNRYIPLLRENGFTRITLTRVLSYESCDQFTYSLQVEAADITAYQRIVEELFAFYEKWSQELFAERVVHFTSLLKKITIE